MTCTRCGYKNPEDARFCAQCGNGLQTDDAPTAAIILDPDDDVAVSLEGLSPGQALLVIKGGPTAGSTVLVDTATTVLGRHPDCDLFLNDVTVSRRHAEIRREGTRFAVKDAGSLNGTYVNRERVDSAELSSGDELQIGKFKIVFYAAPAGDA